MKEDAKSLIVPNQKESDGHICQTKDHKICPSCLHFKFRKSESPLITKTSSGKYLYTLDIELSKQIYNVLKSEKPWLYLFPKPYGRKIETKCTKFRPTTTISKKRITSIEIESSE